MTILNYDTVLETQKVFINFTGRDVDILNVKIVNQETKTVYDDVAFTQNFESVILFYPTQSMIDGMTKESTLSAVLSGLNDEVIYRDIIVFEGRVESKNDYKENQSDNTGYVFA